MWVALPYPKASLLAEGLLQPCIFLEELKDAAGAGVSVFEALRSVKALERQDSIT